MKDSGNVFKEENKEVYNNYNDNNTELKNNENINNNNSNSASKNRERSNVVKGKKDENINYNASFTKEELKASYKEKGGTALNNNENTSTIEYLLLILYLIQIKFFLFYSET